MVPYLVLKEAVDKVDSLFFIKEVVGYSNDQLCYFKQLIFRTTIEVAYAYDSGVTENVLSIAYSGIKIYSKDRI